MKIIWVGIIALIVGVIAYTIQSDKGKGIEIYQIMETYDVQK